MSNSDEKALDYIPVRSSPVLSSKESFNISDSTIKSEIDGNNKSTESSDNSVKKKYDDCDNSNSSLSSTEIDVTGVKTPWPSEGELGPSLGTLFGLDPQFLKSLGIIPPLDKWIHITNFRCDKSELKEVLELAGHVVICAMVTIRMRYAKVMYSHPLEAVQAVSMLNDQTFYGKKLKVTMVRCPPETIILPKGLMKVGPGLGTKGLPLRDIVKHYKKYMKQQESMVDPTLFARSDDWNFASKAFKNGENSIETDTKLLEEETKEASCVDIKRKRRLSESLIVKSVEDFDYAETLSPSKKSKKNSNNSPILNFSNQSSDDEPHDINQSQSFELVENRSFQRDASQKEDFAKTCPDASKGSQPPFQASALPLHSAISTSRPISPLGTSRPSGLTIGSTRPLGPSTISATSAIPGIKQFPARVSCPPGYNMNNPSVSPGLNMRLTRTPGTYSSIPGSIGPNVSQPAPPGLNINPSTLPGMNMGSFAKPDTNLGSSAQPGMIMGSSASLRINMGPSGSSGMNVHPSRPNIGSSIPGSINRGPGLISSGSLPVNMAFGPGNMNSGSMTGHSTPFRPGLNVRPPLSNQQIRPGMGQMPIQQPSTQTSLPESLTLQFRNLPPSTTFPLLCEKLSLCGQVLSLQLTTPGCAIARFSQRAHAERCFQYFNGKCVEGCVIEMRFV